MILVDTEAVVWAAISPSLLSKVATSAMKEARASAHGLAIADWSLCETAMLVARGRVRPAVSLTTLLQLIERIYVVLPVIGSVAERSMLFSDAYPKDPADRIIGATALVHGIPLVTSDKLIRKSGEVPCIW